jgi:hypothetical protein
MPNESEVADAIEDLLEVRRAAARARLETAIKRRNALKAILDAGLEPARDDPRHAWLRGSVLALSSVLEKLAEDFNAVNPDDCITTLDMQDALTTTIGALMDVSQRATRRAS